MEKIVLNLSGIYKNLIIYSFALCALTVPTLACRAEGELFDSDLDIDYIEENSYDSNTAYINDIQILGSNIIKPEYILSKMSLKKGDLYDKDAMQKDLKTIYKLGYFTERMKAIPVKNSNGTISLKIIVEENIPVTDFTIEGNTVVSSEEIMQYLLPLKGKPQNIAAINQAMEQINQCYYNKGYILSKIDSLYDDPDGTLNISITEGKINKIMITGNEKTKDYIIERNVMTEPGGVYNENQIKQDLVRLYSTQAFKDVNRTIEASEEDPDKFDVTIELKEQRTASVSIGGGLDSATGVFGSLGISDNNFRGLNQRVSLTGMVGSGVLMSDSSILNKVNYQAEISFFEPHFLNSDNSLMSRIYIKNGDFEKANTVATKAYNYNLSNINTLLTLGDIAYKNNKYKQALKYYKKAAKSRSSVTEAKLKLADTYAKLNNTKTSVSIYEKLIKTDATAYKAFYHVALNNPDAELNYLKKSVAINPYFKDGWIDLSRIMIENGNLTMAKKYLENAYYIDGSDFRYYYYQSLLIKKTEELNKIGK